MADGEDLRAVASKAEERLDALEQAMFKDRDEVRALFFFLTKTVF